MPQLSRKRSCRRCFNTRISTAPGGPHFLLVCFPRGVSSPNCQLCPRGVLYPFSSAIVSWTLVNSRHSKEELLERVERLKAGLPSLEIQPSPEAQLFSEFESPAVSDGGEGVLKGRDGLGGGGDAVPWNVAKHEGPCASRCRKMPPQSLSVRPYGLHHPPHPPALPPPSPRTL